MESLDSIIVREAGPERAAIELRWRIGERSHIVQRLHVYARSARIDFVTDVDWHERQALLKVGFPTGIRNRRATYEIQFGTIDRPTHTNTSWEEAAFEVPAQRWADLSDAHYGVALLADCKHGYIVREDTLWLSLLKGAIDRSRTPTAANTASHTACCRTPPDWGTFAAPRTASRGHCCGGGQAPTPAPCQLACRWPVRAMPA